MHASLNDSLSVKYSMFQLIVHMTMSSDVYREELLAAADEEEHAKLLAVFAKHVCITYLKYLHITNFFIQEAKFGKGRKMLLCTS